MNNIIRFNVQKTKHLCINEQIHLVVVSQHNCALQLKVMCLDHIKDVHHVKCAIVHHFDHMLPTLSQPKLRISSNQKK